MDKVYKTVIDNDNTKWEVISTSKSGNRNFDIYKNGVNQDYGAYKPSDIDSVIDFLRQRDIECENSTKDIKEIMLCQNKSI